jgi:hypothetical protein
MLKLNGRMATRPKTSPTDQCYERLRRQVLAARVRLRKSISTENRVPEVAKEYLDALRRFRIAAFSAIRAETVNTRRAA